MTGSYWPSSSWWKLSGVEQISCFGSSRDGLRAEPGKPTRGNSKSSSTALEALEEELYPIDAHTGKPVDHNLALLRLKWRIIAGYLAFQEAAKILTCWSLWSARCLAVCLSVSLSL